MKKEFVFLIFCLISLSAYAGNIEVLNQSEIDKITDYQATINQGEKYLKQSNAYLASIKSLTSTGKQLRKDSTKLTNKYQRTRLLAASDLDDGYEDMYKLYFKAIERVNKNEANSKVDDFVEAAKICHKNGRKFFKNIPEEMDKKKAVKLLNLGIENEQNAIERLKDAIDVFAGGVGRNDKSLILTAPKFEVVALHTDSVIAKPKQDQLVEVIIPVARIDSSSLITNAAISMDNAITFFSIQIEASKVKLSQKEISFKYRGSYLVVMMEGDGYYRYSIGKFASIADAQSVVDKEKIKGYIVGYLNNKRVALGEVTKALSTKKQ